MTSIKRSWICSALLFALVAFEFFLSRILEGDYSTVNLSIGIISTVVLITGFIYLAYHKSLKWPNLNTLRKLFQNIVSSWMPLIILLFFLIHLEWISNAGYDAFFTDRGFVWRSFLVMVVGIVVVIVSVCLYPTESKAKPANERELIVCGLSLSNGGKCISPKNIDLLIKPFLDNEWVNSNCKAAPIRTMVILPSKDTLPKFSELTTSDTVFSDLKIDNLVQKYNDCVSRTCFDGHEKTIKDLIELLTGKQGFKVVISSPQADYDNMNDSLKRIGEILNEYEVGASGIRETGNTLLYISPGTGVIGSALTAFSIPGDRTVLYFSQTQDDNHLYTIGLQTGAHNSIIEEILNHE